MTTVANQTLSPGQIPEAPPAPIPDEYVENLNIHLICPDCKEFPPNIVEEFSSGDCVCGSCGLVLGDRIVDTRSEWRTFSNDDSGTDDPSRVGNAANPLLNGSQLETSIAYVDGNSRSRELHRAHAKMSSDKSARGLLQAYKQIGDLCNACQLPTIVSDTAKHLYKLTDDAKAFKGKSTDAIIAGCIFIACRQCKVGRTFREIYNLTQVTKKEIGRTFKALEKFFAQQGRQGNSLVPGVPNEAYQVTESTSARELCVRYGSMLALPNYVVACSQSLAAAMVDTATLAGRSPLSGAAACIYMASHLMGHPKSPKEIAAVAGVSDGTIRTAYKNLYQDRDKVIDQKWLMPQGKGDLKRLPAA